MTWSSFLAVRNSNNVYSESTHDTHLTVHDLIITTTCIVSLLMILISLFTISSLQQWVQTVTDVCLIDYDATFVMID